jgi:hypothetical protein
VFCGDKYETATTKKIYENEEDIKNVHCRVKLRGVNGELERAD